MLVVPAVALSLYTAILTLGDFYLLFTHARMGRRMLAMERAVEATLTSETAGEPLVCLQLPVHNEPAAIDGAIDALCRIDWPTHRLEILVLDDSTDGTADLAAAGVSKWSVLGRNIKVVHRPHRHEFKAGALQLGLAHTHARYVAVFDVDYRPDPSFLRRAMAFLMADEKAAFVQARLDYRNRTSNWLTRAQALELDTQFAYEQAARNWAGVPMMFNGTCGIWRREAIEQAGGWSGRSLAEDQDLSQRAYAKGWASRCLLTISAAGELPDSLGILVRQRRRWSTGTTQALRTLPWDLIKRLAWHQAAPFALLSLLNATSSLALMFIVVLAALTRIFEPKSFDIVFIAALVPIALIVLTKSAGAALATRALGRHLGVGFASDVLRMWMLQLVLLPVGGLSFISGLLSNDRPFVRTPKSRI